MHKWNKQYANNIDNAKNIDVVMNMCNLIEYIENCL